MGIKTYIEEIDRTLDLDSPNTHIIINNDIATYSTIASHIFYYNCILGKKKGTYISSELTQEQIFNKILALHSQNEHFGHSSPLSINNIQAICTHSIRHTFFDHLVANMCSSAKNMAIKKMEDDIINNLTNLKSDFIIIEHLAISDNINTVIKELNNIAKKTNTYIFLFLASDNKEIPLEISNYLKIQSSPNDYQILINFYKKNKLIISCNKSIYPDHCVIENIDSELVFHAFS